MRRTVRLTIAGLLAGAGAGLALAAPAHAHEMPAPGFNAVLHDPHHDKVATDETWPDCDTVAGSLGADADALITDGHDTWVFYIPEGTFDTSGAIASLRFEDIAGDPRLVDVPGDGTYRHWIAGDTGRLAVAVPAGWTLADGDFAVMGSPYRVEVKRTCPDGSPGAPGATPSPSGEDGGDGMADPAGEDPDDPAGEAPTDDGDGATGGGQAGGEGGGLAVTGAQVGGMVILGVGLLAAGIAMSAVKRRRDLGRLLSTADTAAPLERWGNPR